MDKDQGEDVDYIKSHSVRYLKKSKGQIDVKGFPVWAYIIVSVITVVIVVAIMMYFIDGDSDEDKGQTRIENVELRM